MSKNVVGINTYGILFLYKINIRVKKKGSIYGTNYNIYNVNYNFINR